MSASLKDIASKLNLSKTTVSWVLSGQGDKKGISAETRERVFKCAEELNYHPNLLARSLHSGSSNTIGLIVPQISDGFYAAIADQVEEEANNAGYSIMIATSNGEIERENAMIQAFRAKRVDGMIIAPCKVSKKEIVKLQKDNIPVTLFDRYWPELNSSHVIINNEESCYRLTRKLIQRGHKTIALVTTNPHLLTMNMRREGYVNALTDAGMDVRNELQCVVPYAGYKENIVPVLDKLFEEVPDVDGFIFTTHILAIEAFRYFSARGIDFTSERWGLGCMHSDDLFRVIAPNIDIAHFPIRGIGTNAVRILLNQINARMQGDEYTPEFMSVPCQMDYWDQ